MQVGKIYLYSHGLWGLVETGIEKLTNEQRIFADAELRDIQTMASKANMESDAIFVLVETEIPNNKELRDKYTTNVDEIRKRLGKKFVLLPQDVGTFFDIQNALPQNANKGTKKILQKTFTSMNRAHMLDVAKKIREKLKDLGFSKRVLIEAGGQFASTYKDKKNKRGKVKRNKYEGCVERSAKRIAAFLEANGNRTKIILNKRKISPFQSKKILEAANMGCLGGLVRNRSGYVRMGRSGSKGFLSWRKGIYNQAKPKPATKRR